MQNLTQLFFSKYDKESKGYITKEDLHLLFIDIYSEINPSKNFTEFDFQTMFKTLNLNKNQNNKIYPQDISDLIKKIF